MQPNPSTRKLFAAQIYEGHSDRAVVVPFDPGIAWKTIPRRIGHGRHKGHAVCGTVEGEPFESWIWFYFDKWRMVIADAVLENAAALPGDLVEIAVTPHPKPESVASYRPGPQRG